MAKVNLLTIHYGENNGSLLQTYATVQILRELGHDVTVIDLQKKQCTVRHYIQSLYGWRRLPNLLGFNMLRKKHLSPMTLQMTSIDPELIPDADYTIVGSDQTWNPDITADNALAYFLNFVPENCRRIALSASFGAPQWLWGPDLSSLARQEINKFQAVSVRESSGINICRQEFGVEACCLCDPTIAWGKYSSLAGPAKQYNEIFGFILNEIPWFHTIAGELQKDLQIPIRYNSKARIARHTLPEQRKYKAISLSGAIGVPQFLQHIAGSEYVITDSFHGTVFCLLYRKPFISVPCSRPERFERIENLLQKTDLSHRIVRSAEEYRSRRDEILAPVDFSAAEEFLQQSKKEFYDFVRDNIK